MQPVIGWYAFLPACCCFSSSASLGIRGVSLAHSTERGSIVPSPLKCIVGPPALAAAPVERRPANPVSQSASEPDSQTLFIIVFITWCAVTGKQMIKSKVIKITPQEQPPPQPHTLSVVGTVLMTLLSTRGLWWARR